jgi:hypothetical protein
LSNDRSLGKGAGIFVVFCFKTKKNKKEKRREEKRVKPITEHLFK